MCSEEGPKSLPVVGTKEDTVSWHQSFICYALSRQYWSFQTQGMKVVLKGTPRLNSMEAAHFHTNPQAPCWAPSFPSKTSFCWSPCCETEGGHSGLMGRSTQDGTNTVSATLYSCWVRRLNKARGMALIGGSSSTHTGVL